MQLAQLHSGFTDVAGSQMHYLYCGMGDPILFVHGVPTSSYLWRNIMPYFADQGYCCAIDLIGMGQSDKPKINFTIDDHIFYLTEFINALELENITLVLHGWGSVAGLHYAANHPDNVKALVLFESHVRPVTDWDLLSLPVQQFANMLNDMESSYKKVIEENYIVRQLLPNGIVNTLSDTELAVYEGPFQTPEDRKVLWQYVLDLPMGEVDNETLPIIESYSAWLQQTSIPKLLMYAVPGFITTVDTVQWVQQNVKNIDLVCLENVMHYAQESAPGLFATKMREWFINNKRI